MIAQLLRPEVQKFILEHELDDEKKLVLKYREIDGIPSSVIADQISGRRKSKTKLPLYFNTRNIVYPPALNLEQSSSEKTAAFKAAVIKSIVDKAKTVADATGGFGVDTLFFSRSFKNVLHIEPNASLSEIAQHNHQILSAKNIEYSNLTAEAFLKSRTEKAGIIYLDPSRRKLNQKVFKLSECEPNVPELLQEIFQKTDYLLIKTSPLLDIQQGIKELQHVKEVYVVSVENECKELLFLCQKGFVGNPSVIAINLTDNEEKFSFTLEEEKACQSEFSRPITYLYEPNASILKAGAFKLVGKIFSIHKLQPSTHLYTSAAIVQNFPGRIFKILQLIKPDAKSLREIFTNGKANIMTRNYPLSPEELKKKTKLKDGGDLYLIGFSGLKEKFLVAAERIK